MNRPLGTSETVNATAMYRHRFSDEERQAMAKVWRILIDHFFHRWIRPDDTVLDVGAGLCNFINQVNAGRKIAVDIDPSVADRCNSDVLFVECSCDALAGADLGGKIDVAFISNLLEHLASGEEVLSLFKALSGHLNSDGRLIILQPNFALVGAEYFDFIDHKTVLTDKSLVEALELSGFEVIYLRKRFLPYTSKSSIPKAPWLVWLYIKFPLAQYIMGKQTLVIAKPTCGEPFRRRTTRCFTI